MKTNYCRGAMLLAAGCLLALGGLAIGGDRDREMILPRPDRMRVGLDVLVDGKPLRTIPYRGRIYLPVPRMGAEYQIRVWNHGPRRISAIVSVDGLSVINGRRASEASPGYIVSPHRSVLIKGWRRSLDEVAAFSFVDREDSYAARMGWPENIGVIGLLAFEEQAPLPLLREKKDAARAPAAKALSGRVGSIGTGYGREIDSRAYYVPFVRSANRRSITLYYDTEEALRKAGIVKEPPMPIPFPDSQEFAPPPPGYKRH